jgi:WD40 repeat protein
VELVLVPGARPVDLLRKLNECQPQVVHFSSHGSPDELLLEADGGQEEAVHWPGTTTRSAQERDMTNVGRAEGEGARSSQALPHPVSRSALAEVLRACDEGELRLVVLNACDTRPHAEALTEVVDCVVSMNREITNRAAIMFAASFYGALAHGRSVQRAFDQGVARLRAEGLAEEGTPELLARARVDASRIVLVVPAPAKTVKPAVEIPFLVPFPRNAGFVGRDGDLARLHAALSGPGPVGIRPAGLTGMGGIGKTQLAVEYVHRSRGDYPDGIFWIDAAAPLAEGFARLATDPRLRWIESDRPRDEQIRVAFTELNRRPCSLLVLDNLSDPAAIAVAVLAGYTPEDLGCRLLFTTRRHDLGRFTGVEVTVLPEDPALRLLLRHPSRQAALDPSHLDHEHARAIARMLGRLPLALELAGAYLGKFSGDITLADYRSGLKADGALATLDADAEVLSEADLRRVHDRAVAATIDEQWQTLQDESAQLLLRVASLFPESAAVPIARLGLLAGLRDEARPGRLSALRRSVKRLDDACLLERLEGDKIRLHPLVREFAALQTPSAEKSGFITRCLARVVESLEDFPTLERIHEARGIDGLQEDVIAILDFWSVPSTELTIRLQSLLRLLQREAHILRRLKPGTAALLLAQQVRNRALLMGITTLRFGADRKLEAIGKPHALLRWRVSRESSALQHTLMGHDGFVTSVATKRDSRAALSGSSDGTIRVWDLTSGRELHTLIGHEGFVSSVAVSADGTLAISGSSDGTVKVWDLASGVEFRTLRAHTGWVSSVFLDDNGLLAVSVSDDQTVNVWDLTSGVKPGALRGHGGFVTALFRTLEGHLGVAGSSNGTVRIWDLTASHELLTLQNNTGSVTALCVTHDGRFILVGTRTGEIHVWDLNSGRMLRTLKGHDNWVNAVSSSTDGRLVFSGSSDLTVKVWDLEDGQNLRSFSGHTGFVTSVVATHDNRRVISGSNDGTVKVWDLTMGQELKEQPGHSSRIRSTHITPDGGVAITSSFDRTIVWELATGEALHSLRGCTASLSLVVKSSDGYLVLCPCAGNAVRVLDLESGKELLRLSGHGGPVNTMAATPDARIALSGSNDGSAKVWDLAVGRELRSLEGCNGGVKSVAVSCDGRLALVACFQGLVRVLDIESGREVRHFIARDSGLKFWAVSTDGRFACTTSFDGFVALWDLDREDVRATIVLDSEPASLVLAPDGRTVLVGGGAGNVYAMEFVGIG